MGTRAQQRVRKRRDSSRIQPNDRRKRRQDHIRQTLRNYEHRTRQPRQGIMPNILFQITRVPFSPPGEIRKVQAGFEAPAHLLPALANGRNEGIVEFNHLGKGGGGQGHGPVGAVGIGEGRVTRGSRWEAAVPRNGSWLGCKKFFKRDRVETI